MDQNGTETKNAESPEELLLQIQELTLEQEKIKEEFNIQRAKLKELFLQKEAELAKSYQENVYLKEEVMKLKNELDDCKSQLVVDSILESNFEAEKRKADEEIATLQRLIHETVEESSSSRTLYDSELSKLQSYIQQLQRDIMDLKREKSQSHSPFHSTQEHSSLAPSQMLNVLTKGLKKLGADSFSSQDSDDGIKKPQEDTELLHSLMEPLADQIKALKEKLRATDEELQRYKGGINHGEKTADQSKNINLNATAATNTSFDSQKLTTCDMCSNYEAQLVKEQQRARELEIKVQNAEKAAERHKEELLKEIGFRKDMEEKWNEKKEEHKKQVAELTRMTECTEQDLKELRQHFNEICGELKMSLGKLTHEREFIQQQLQRLQSENENLVGKFVKHSQELQSEVIDLPSNIEELHELILKIQQNLILTKMGKEAAEETVNILQLDISYWKQKLASEQHEKKAIEENLEADLRQLRRQIDQLEKEKKRFLTNQEKSSSAEKEKQDVIGEQREKMAKMTETIASLEKQVKELRTSNSALQHELDNTEAVQKDFVILSQNLQIQLEKIRESDCVVRWQHEEDVNECPSCRTGFASNKQKHHCRHCGQIFCHSCLTKTVPSGPHNRPSRVCDVCHTLLVKSSAPYFSETAPITD